MPQHQQPDHPEHGDMLRRLSAIETKLDGLRYVSPDLLDARLEAIKADVAHVREDVGALKAADQQRRTQVYGAILGVIVALVIGLIRSGVAV